MRSKKAIYNILTNLLLQVIIIIYGFIVPKIIINYFGSAVNGLVSSITQFLAYISLLEAGFGPVVKSLLYKPIANNDESEIFNILRASEKFFRKISIVFIFYIILLCIFYPLLVNNSFSPLFTISLIFIISISTFAEYYFGMTYRLFLQAEQQKYIISLIQIVTYLLNIVLIVILTKYNVSIHMIKLFAGLIFVLRPLCQNYYVKRKFNINFDFVDENYKIDNKWDGFAQHIAAVVHGNTDITVLTCFCELAEVSVYSVYYLVVSGIKSVINALTGGIDASFGDMIARNENDNLIKKFNLYELVYMMLITIIFTSTIILIVPFVSVYTKGITDANYIRYTFGTLIVISEYIWAMRVPYSSITLAAGHFKETRVGAWVECLSNIIISVLLVSRYGIVGVAIGTIIAMTMRTIEFIYHTNKYILHRSMWISIKKIILLVFSTITIIFLSKYIPYFDNINYYNWVINGVMVFILSFVVSLFFEFLFYKDELKEFFIFIKNVIFRKKRS